MTARLINLRNSFAAIAAFQSVNGGQCHLVKRRPLRRRPWLVLTIAIVACVLPMSARSCDAIDALERFRLTGVSPQGAECSLFVGTDRADGTSCRWEYGFRDKGADSYASELAALLQTCRTVQELPADQPVNHPDSYGLSQWTAADAVFRISVKDKGALGRTYVFFALETE